METFRLGLLSYPVIADYLKEKNTLLIPFGTLEGHGKHLPVSTDTLIAEDIASALAKRLEVLVAPSLEYGITNSMYRYPAGSTFPEQIYSGFVEAMLSSFASHGFTQLLLINGHGGNIKTLNDCVSRFAKKPGHRAAAFHWWETVSELTTTYFKGDGGHASAEETAMVQAINNEYVRQESYSPDTEFIVPSGVFVHPVPGPVIFNKQQGARPDFNRKHSLEYRQQVIDHLEELSKKVLKGWQKLDEYERGL